MIDQDYLFDRLFAVSNAPFTIYDPAFQPIRYMPDTPLFRKLASLYPASLRELETNATLVRSAEILSFGAVKLGDGKTIIFGPLSVLPCERIEAQRILTLLGDKDTDFLSIVNYFSMVMAGSVPQMASLLDLVNHAINGDTSSVLDRLRSSAAHVNDHSEAPKSDTPFHNSEYYENTLYSFIESGQPEQLKNFRSKGSFEGNVGNVANDFIRKYKNLLLGSIVLASRAAVRGGLNYDTALYISDSYMRSVERIFDLPSLGRLNTSMLQKYAELVQQCRLGGSNSKFVLSVNNYILRHVNESITGQQIADSLRINRSYLCQRFKAETGISVGRQILAMKMEEAKRLLSSNEYGILDVAVMLDYATQSSFHTAFKAYTGMTPRVWRSTHQMQTHG